MHQLGACEKVVNHTSALASVAREASRAVAWRPPIHDGNVRALTNVKQTLPKTHGWVLSSDCLVPRGMPETG